jgi:poly-gamma-glutamate capsule biosynthesis protein CapA/YwtB (metallophosphatase superfamily)
MRGKLFSIKEKEKIKRMELVVSSLVQRPFLSEQSYLPSTMNSMHPEHVKMSKHRRKGDANHLPW